MSDTTYRALRRFLNRIDQAFLVAPGAATGTRWFHALWTPVNYKIIRTSRDAKNVREAETVSLQVGY